MILIYSPSCVNITKSLIHMSAKILLREKSFQINFVFEKASIFELEFFSEFMELNVNLNVSYSSERMILVADFRKSIIDAIYVILIPPFMYFNWKNIYQMKICKKKQIYRVFQHFRNEVKSQKNNFWHIIHLSRCNKMQTWLLIYWRWKLSKDTKWISFSRLYLDIHVSFCAFLWFLHRIH